MADRCATVFCSGPRENARRPALPWRAYALLGLLLAGCGGTSGTPSTSTSSVTGERRDAGAHTTEAGATDASGERDATASFDFSSLGVDAGPLDGSLRPVPTTVPTRYACDPTSYADGVFCDCGCGAVDPDCGRDGCSAAGCKDSACDVRHGAGGALLVPGAWSCERASYGTSDGCDCGCGALDPDCATRGGGCSAAGCIDAQCDHCHRADGALSTCRFACDLTHFGTHDGCDCGCGEPDPDCGGLGCDQADCVAAACTRCWAEGAIASTCARSACEAARFSDSVCDCGCREADPDCAGLVSCVSPGCSEPSCGRCHAADGGNVRCDDWYCTLEQQGAGDGCNCGCGALDPDCERAGCAEPGCAAPACVSCRSAEKATMSCAP